MSLMSYTRSGMLVLKDPKAQKYPQGGVNRDEADRL